MTVIKIIEGDVKKTINPLFISHVKFFPKDKCVVILLPSVKTSDSVFTKTFKTEQEAQDFYDYVNSCLESINE